MPHYIEIIAEESNAGLLTRLWEGYIKTKRESTLSSETVIAGLVPPSVLKAHKERADTGS